MNSILEIIKKIGEKENDITSQEFISPVFFNNQVATKIEHILYTFSIPSMSPGWYKFKPTNKKEAKSIQKADLIEIDSYLNFLPKIRLVLVMKQNNVYLAVAEKNNKFGISSQNPVPVFLFDDSVFDFDRIIARFDGANFWYHSIDSINDLSKATYLREQLLKLTDKLNYSGLTFEEKLAYSLRFNLDKHLVEDRKKSSLQEDVEHAGGKFIDFTEKSTYYSVRYKVDGQEYTSHVTKDTKRQVITAGICLSGGDSEFDLKSLVTVLREGQQRRLIHRTR